MGSNREINPSVEKFLTLVKKSRRGNLKIYIGLAAGVGKTYRMLQEAHQLQANGVDIIMGYVESHGRKETEKLLEGLTVIPRKKIYYKGRELEELDIDAVLKRRPEVVVIDELAHTNMPGSRNKKRYEDVEEILFNGISIITAVNIQHIESLNPVVEKVTGVEVKETVSDKIFGLADEVVNIDLTIDELIERLQSGKIYKMEKVENALQNFFRKENLLRLRELALREVANHVEKKIEFESLALNKLSPERILVCLGDNIKLNEKIIRESSRTAGRLNAKWYVVYVETGKESFEDLDLQVQRHVINNFKLATELGAVTEKVKSDSLLNGIMNYVKRKKITKIVVGRPRKEFSIKRLLRGNILNKLLDALEDKECDLEVIN